MAIFENNININDLIQITSGGVTVARFDQVRDLLIKSMQNIYGTDIDISPASADAQWIHEVALIINNCLQTIKYSFDMLDPAAATGKYLDILCSFNNIQRNLPTNSTAQLWIKNISRTVKKPAFISFVDKSGNYWRWTNPVNADGELQVTWAPNEIVAINNVICENLGPIVAKGNSLLDPDPSTGTKETIEHRFDNLTDAIAGDINQTVDYGTWKVYQEKDAETGYDEETDESLRSRRIQSLGNQSVSVLSGLHGSLLSLNGIDDVYIINAPKAINNLSDGMSLPAHSVYVCLRYKENANIPDSNIGEIIYNKLTPGIPTVKYDTVYPKTADPEVGESKEYEILKLEDSENPIVYTIYWKKCLPFILASSIVIKLNCSNELYNFPNKTVSHDVFDEASTDVEKNIVKQILNYTNNIKIGQKLNAVSLSSAIQRGDTPKQGLGTFVLTSNSLNSDVEVDLKLSYMELKEEHIKFSYGTPGDYVTQCTITIDNSEE